MDITIATGSHRLSIDTDLGFALIAKGNTFRRTTDPDVVRALATVIFRLTPADDALAARLWDDLSPMVDHDHKPQPVKGPAFTVSVAYPPTGVSACKPASGPSTHRRFHPRPLKAASFECRAYDSESEQVWKRHHWWRGPEHKAGFRV